MNVYTLLNDELNRLHTMLQKQDGSTNGKANAPVIWEKITAIQEVIIKSYQANDRELQLKIAETILLDNANT